MIDMEERRRNRNLNVRLTDQEHEMLTDLAEHVGLSASDVIRQYIRKEYAAVFGKPAQPRRSRR